MVNYFIQNVTFSYAVDMMIGELYVITFVTAIKITMDWLQEQKKYNLYCRKHQPVIT